MQYRYRPQVLKCYKVGSLKSKWSTHLYFIQIFIWTDVEYERSSMFTANIFTWKIIIKKRSFMTVSIWYFLKHIKSTNGNKGCRCGLLGMTMKWKKHDISALYCCKSCHKVMVQNEFTCIRFAHLCLALTERQNLCKSLCNSVSVWAGVCIEGFASETLIHCLTVNTVGCISGAAT